MVILQSVEAQLQGLDDLLKGLTGNLATSKDREVQKTASHKGARANKNSLEKQASHPRARKGCEARGSENTSRELQGASHAVRRDHDIPAQPNKSAKSARSEANPLEDINAEAVQHDDARKLTCDVGARVEVSFQDDDLLARAREFVRQANALFPDSQKEDYVPDAVPAETKESVVHLEKEDETPDLDEQSIASDDSLCTPRAANPPKTYMWVPLARGGMTARGSDTIYFQSDICGPNAFTEKVAQDVLVCGHVYRVASIEKVSSGGVKVILTSAIVSAARQRDKDNEGFVKVFAKMCHHKLTTEQIRRARLCGKGHVYGLIQASSRSSRGREATERKLMAVEEASQRQRAAEDQRKQALEVKAAELRARTKARLQKQARERRAAEKAKQEAEAMEAMERVKQESRVQDELIRAAELSRKRIAQHRLREKRKQSLAETQERVKATNSNSEGSSTSRTETPDLVRKSRERVRLRKESLRAAQAALQAQQEPTSGRSCGETAKTRLSEEEMRRATRERRERFIKVARSVREEEEAKYARTSRKTKSRPNTTLGSTLANRVQVQILPSPRKTRFPPLTSNSSFKPALASASTTTYTRRGEKPAESNNRMNKNNSNSNNNNDCLSDDEDEGHMNETSVHFKVREVNSGRAARSAGDASATSIPILSSSPAAATTTSTSTRRMNTKETPPFFTQASRRGSYLFH